MRHVIPPFYFLFLSLAGVCYFTPLIGYEKVTSPSVPSLLYSGVCPVSLKQRDPFFCFPYLLSRGLPSRTHVGVSAPLYSRFGYLHARNDSPFPLFPRSSFFCQSPFDPLRCVLEVRRPKLFPSSPKHYLFRTVFMGRFSPMFTRFPLPLFFFPLCFDHPRCLLRAPLIASSGT